MTERVITRVLVTGCAGHLGSAIAQHLGRDPRLDVVPLARSAERLPSGGIAVDLVDEAALRACLAEVRPDVVIHAAGRVGGTAHELWRDNAAATSVLAETVLRTCPHAVLTGLGSAAEYGLSADGRLFREDDPLRPAGLYGHTKVAGGAYLASAASRGLRFNWVRVFNPVAMRNSTRQVLGAAIVRLAEAQSRGDVVIRMRRLDAVRDFVAIGDILRLVGRLATERIAGQLVNACSGQARCVRDVITGICARAGLDVEVIEEPSTKPHGGADLSVGDPVRFLDLAVLSQVTDIEEILAAAWSLAVDEVRRHGPRPGTSAVN